MYQGICSCGSNYVVETMRNAAPGIDEYDQPHGISEPSKHFQNNPGYKSDWVILSSLKRKFLKAYFIKQLN